MREILLTQGKIALVDDCDFEYLNQWKWCTAKDGNTFYAVRGRTPSIRMHRIIIERMYGRQFKEIDHKDRNGLNNQRVNLRSVTTADNQHNQKVNKNNTSGYTGVRCDRGVWRACIQIHGKRRDLGYFNNPLEAAKAYNAAALEHFGEFARLNPV